MKVVKVEKQCKVVVCTACYICILFSIDPLNTGLFDIFNPLTYFTTLKPLISFQILLKFPV